MNYVARLSTFPVPCRSFQTLTQRAIYLCLRKEDLTVFTENDSQGPSEVESTQNMVGGESLNQVMKITLPLYSKECQIRGAARRKEYRRGRSLVKRSSKLMFNSSFK
ncbi:hypothetical protein L798_07206 [Zootermopsis nevadensis]|uniref:Uncharacterized protein n=1 Tax=Zootermopsis nevadensis TaxID=136037 RepID=A0A067R796_ZOONE|nr:hypothetical protein L798_07206 [Zootermopsis nevadensis]